MTSGLETIFWVSIFLVIYTYALYPVILILMSICSGKGAGKILGSTEGASWNSPVSMVIAAYNEEKVIEAKLRNCMEIDYPADKIEFLVGSDGSTDNTNGIVSSYAGNDRRIKLIDIPDRRGKASVLNRIVAGAKGDFLVFSDANTMYERDAIRKLIAPFSDPGIGCVCGKLVISRPEKSTSNDDLYWRYETWLKVKENDLGGVLGANGGIYALRKELFVPIPSNTIIDDFVIGMKVREQRFRVHYAEDAVAREETAESDKAEFRRRIRIGAGNFQSIALLKRLLWPGEGIFAFQFWSHKIIRWCVPFFLLLMFLSNLFLARYGNGYFVILACQVVFYLLAVLGYVTNRTGLLFRVPSFFVSMNLAFFIGFIKYILNVQKVTWERTER
ncbi:MAG: glycosyltransferase family 2 protein [Syntrophobacterales bacterium]|nr:MAG: glycosyltransferase family 2 protein [Syntrophobacterales bacterium]